MLAQSQNILVCSVSSVLDSSGICPPGQSLSIVQAYVLTEDGYNFFTELTNDIDYSQLGQGFGFGFSIVLISYCLGKGIGMLLRTIR